MSNEIRGEVEFEVDEFKFTARPTFALAAELESIFKRSIFSMVRAAGAAQLGVTEVIVITALAARMADDGPDEAKKRELAFRERCFQFGVLRLTAPVTQLLTNIFNTGRVTKNGEAGTASA